MMSTSPLRPTHAKPAGGTERNHARVAADAQRGLIYQYRKSPPLHESARAAPGHAHTRSLHTHVEHTHAQKCKSMEMHEPTKNARSQT
jgi:hypothetical protein